MAKQFEVSGHTYTTGKIPARTQHHLLRRLAPFMGAIMALQGVRAQGEGAAAVIGPMAEVLSKVSDADSNFIFDTCLAGVKRRQGDTGWVDIAVPGSDQLMFDDIDLLAQYLIIWEVLTDSLGPFIEGVVRLFRSLFPATDTSPP